MLVLAEKGDVRAAKLIWLMATTGTADGDVSKTPPVIRIVVENATFKATVTPTATITEATDAEFTESK